MGETSGYDADSVWASSMSTLFLEGGGRSGTYVEFIRRGRVEVVISTKFPFPCWAFGPSWEVGGTEELESSIFSVVAVSSEIKTEVNGSCRMGMGLGAGMRKFRSSCLFW